MPSVPAEGRIARRHERGTGCGGRESVGASSWSQGGIARERCLARKTNDGSAYGKTVWSRHPLLVPSLRRFCWPDRVWQNLNLLATVTRRIRRRGERGISRKTIAQGMPDCSVCTCFSRVRSSHYLHTRPRVQNAPGIPCPSFLG